MDLILFVMPDGYINRLVPAIQKLRAEGVKVIAYEPSQQWPTGVDSRWYWQNADSHWTEAAVRLTADEILRMWKTQSVANRPFSTELAEAFSIQAEQAKDLRLPSSLARPENFSILVNKAPNFENSDGWGTGYSLAKSQGMGVVVGPGPEAPSVFAQSFSAKPNEIFKIVAQASSVDKAHAKGRLQINWHAADGSYLSTSSRVIDVLSTTRTFDFQTSVPPKATSGVLYVAPHGLDDRVRYTEMKLLKSSMN